MHLDLVLTDISYFCEFHREQNREFFPVVTMKVFYIQVLVDFSHVIMILKQTHCFIRVRSIRTDQSKVYSCCITGYEDFQCCVMFFKKYLFLCKQLTSKKNVAETSHSEIL